MSRVGVFLQVRLDSTRLPQKALLPLSGKPVVELAMEALKKVPADVYALVTDRDSYQALSGYADAVGFETFLGPKDDVLQRYADAIKYFQVDTVIRATGDNPLVSGECGALLLELYTQNCEEYRIDYSGFDGLPVGTGVECVRAEALLRANREAESSYDREHVCPYLYNHPDFFKVYRPVAPKECFFPKMRVTLDTDQDYRRLQTIFNTLYSGKPITTRQLIREISQHHVIAG
ncbi:MAG: NTP transferase domain-containing protein [Spirochaetaceae bacterium]|nr:NTP transferase domain-containing protein [Spirochaetaceae bacterium]MCF7952230.1 NTP transferase domain-containing protein [Spirochaetaceae bacterium]